MIDTCKQQALVSFHIVIAKHWCYFKTKFLRKRFKSFGIIN